MRALIVDDSAVMRKVIERALRQAGLELTEVLQASNGEEGLQALRESASAPVSVILSDINMPVMDGPAVRGDVSCGKRIWLLLAFLW